TIKIEKEKLGIEELKMAYIISIEDFSKVEMKVATIESAEKVENAQKLLKMIVDIGGEKRQLVAGIAEFYEPEELVGKSIIVVTNLAPTKIRGIESNGMLLAATKENRLALLTVDKGIDSGSKIS
ncbi:MAG: methionine--tRNA ligase subunit beta, partial [Candidatus Atribacteria bacterium]|nr:methionine--tRNA ligase subunit beta [Candidatus Atribacteria bacterium]